MRNLLPEEPAPVGGWVEMKDFFDNENGNGKIEMEDKDEDGYDQTRRDEAREER